MMMETFSEKKKKKKKKKRGRRFVVFLVVRDTFFRLLSAADVHFFPPRGDWSIQFPSLLQLPVSISKR